MQKNNDVHERGRISNPSPVEDNSTIRFSLNGRAVEAGAEETILQAAQRHGVEIPRLCYKEGYRADGNCRVCMVEIEGERTLAPSCCRKPSAGMKVNSTTERAMHSQKMVLELLLADMPQQGASPYRLDSELDHWAGKMNVFSPRFEYREPVAPDLSHPAIAVNLDACIQCTRCVRACREEQVNDVIGYAWRGRHSEIVFDMGDLMGESTCVACGECVQACPTGALMPARNVGLVKPDKQVDSVCPYCGVGCLLTFNVKNDHIQYVDGRDGPSNRGRLCVKGRYGFDFVHHPGRLTRPLIRKPGTPKTTEIIPSRAAAPLFPRSNLGGSAGRRGGRPAFNPRLRGSQALAGFGCAKGSNEEAYLFQKLVRTAFVTNNVDHCTRLCHASSVAALLETIGSGAVSNQVADGTRAEVIIVIGARPNDNHPVAATFMKNAAENGSKLIVIEPYSSEMYLHAHAFLQLRPGTDVLLLNGMMHHDHQRGIARPVIHRCPYRGFRRARGNGAGVQSGTGSARVRHRRREDKGGGAPLCPGKHRDHILGHGHIPARARNGQCPLPDLAGADDRTDRPSGHRPAPAARAEQRAGGFRHGPDPHGVSRLPAGERPGNEGQVREILGHGTGPGRGQDGGGESCTASMPREITGMYIMGENPAMSDPNLHHAREALTRLEHLVVQDIFFTETCGFADVILPASAFPEKTGTYTNTDRRVQLGRQAVNPPGDARQDLWIIQELARRLGLDWDYPGPETVFEEIRQAVPSMAGMTWERLEQVDSLTYPLTGEGDPGEPVIFKGGAFPTEDGKGRFVAADYIEAAELPDAEYPFIFMTGRQLEHWHTGTMTRHSRVLNTIEPWPYILVNPGDLRALEMESGDLLAIESRRGRLTVATRVDEGMQQGVVMMPFTYHEAAANLLTNDALDPFGKIPEFKFCAIRVSKN